MKTLKLPLPLKTIVLASLFASLGCVNRGSHTPIDTVDDGGAGGHMMTMNDGAMDQEVMPDSAVDTVVVDNCDDLGDGGDAGPAIDAGAPGSCTAMFSFESPAGCGLYGATLADNLDNPAQTAAFSSLRHSAVAAATRSACRGATSVARALLMGLQRWRDFSRCADSFSSLALSR